MTHSPPSDSTPEAPPEPEATLRYTRRGPTGCDSWPIRIRPSDTPSERSYELVLSDGSKHFDTFSALRQEIHGDTAYATWSIDRYFRFGTYALPMPIGAPGLTLGSTAPSKMSPKLKKLIIAPSGPIPAVLTILMPRRIGVDLMGRHQEVAKLLYAGFGNSIRVNGYDFEDVLQEVFRKILASNAGTKPWNPDRASFGHFVHMVCRSALYNYHRKRNRIRAHEQIGLKGYAADGQWGDVDVADSPLAHTSTPLRGTDAAAVADLQAHLLTQAQGTLTLQADATLAVHILPLVRDGYGRGEIAAFLGLKPSIVSKALAYLRKHARSWR